MYDLGVVSPFVVEKRIGKYQDDVNFSHDTYLSSGPIYIIVFFQDFFTLLISIKFPVCQLPLFESLPLSEDSSSESDRLGGHMLEVLKEGNW